MNSERVRSALVGTDWYFLPLSALAGVLVLAVFYGLGALAGLSPRVELLIFLVPLPIVVAHYGGGLVPCWVLVFPASSYAFVRPCAWTNALCPPPPGPVETLPQSVIAAVSFGTLGFAFSTVVRRRDEDTRPWTPVYYYVLTVTVLGGVVVLYDSFLPYCLPLGC